MVLKCLQQEADNVTCSSCASLRVRSPTGTLKHVFGICKGCLRRKDWGMNRDSSGVKQNLILDAQGPGVHIAGLQVMLAD